MDVINIENTLIHHIEQTPETFLKKTIVLFGPSNTGKTVIVKHVLNILRPYVPLCIAFVPTDNPEDDDSYGKLINPLCVHRDLNKAPEILRHLFKRQMGGRKATSKANNLTGLKNLYEKNRIDKTDVVIRTIMNTANEGRERIIRNPSLTDDQKEDQIKQIEKSKNERLHKLYKDGIIKYHGTLMKEHNDRTNILTEDELFILKYMNYNNNIVVIFDDCMAEINKWGKDDEIKQIFFQGRHIGITTMFVMHSDKGFPPELRQNAFINIFTAAPVAINYFQTKNNGISKELNKKIEKIIEKLFRKSSEPNSPNNYKKLVFMPRDDNQIQYIVAKNLTKFKFGCSGIEKLTDVIKEHEDVVDGQDHRNPFGI